MLTVICVLAGIAATVWVLQYAVLTVFPFLFGIAIFVLLKSAFECINPKFTKYFEDAIGVAIFIVIMGVILL